MVASQDWPEVTKYAGLVCAQEHRQELIQDLYKSWQDPVRGPVTGGMIKYSLPISLPLLQNEIIIEDERKKFENLIHRC